MDIREVTARPEYDFLRNDPHLGRHILFLTFGGSISYGTNTTTSDVDIRGCTLNSSADLLGFGDFEQIVDSDTDTVVFAFNKAISLFVVNNPGALEMLGCKPEHYAFVSDIGRELLQQKALFLSQRVITSFGGYATSQLRRLENNLARHALPEDMKQKHAVDSCKLAMRSFNTRYAAFPEGAIRLYVGPSQRDGVETEIFLDTSLKGYPLRDYQGIWNECNSIVREYERANVNSRMKDDLHLNKHAMHLVRLYLTCFDILEKGEIVTYREKDHDLLMRIRDGGFRKSDGSFNEDFYQLLAECQKRMEYDAANTSLPEQPDMRRVEEFVMSVNERVVKDAY